MDYSSTLLMTSRDFLTISSTLLMTSSIFLTISSTLLIIIVGSCLLIRALVPIDTWSRDFRYEPPTMPPVSPNVVTASAVAHSGLGLVPASETDAHSYRHGIALGGVGGLEQRGERRAGVDDYGSVAGAQVEAQSHGIEIDV